MDSILDYVDLGAELISIRGYDNLNDAIDYGQYILPEVRKALKVKGATETNGKRAANGINAYAESEKKRARVD